MEALVVVEELVASISDLAGPRGQPKQDELTKPYRASKATLLEGGTSCSGSVEDGTLLSDAMTAA